MNNIGVARKVDELGRVVVPKEYRKALGIENGDMVEIFAGTDDDGRQVVMIRAAQGDCLARRDAVEQIQAMIDKAYAVPFELRGEYVRGLLAAMGVAKKAAQESEARNG